MIATQLSVNCSGAALATAGTEPITNNALFVDDESESVTSLRPYLAHIPLDCGGRALA